MKRPDAFSAWLVQRLRAPWLLSQTQTLQSEAAPLVPITSSLMIHIQILRQPARRLLPTADFWHRVGFSALRILTGFVLAVTVGLLLGACGARWRWFGTLVGPVMQLIRAMPVASFVILALLWVSGKNLSVIVSFTHVLPVVYAGTVGGIADTDPALLEMAKVYRLPLGKRLRYIWLPGMFPSFCESCIAAMGMCWKSGVSAEVIGLPDHSVGDALYRAKITISTPEVFAWTLVIVLLSATLSTLAAWALRRAKRALCGEVEG